MYKKLLILILIMILSFIPSKKIFGYGININDYQTHYELQNISVNNGYLNLQGFYYVYELQNYASGTHYYILTLTSSSTGETKTYYDYNPGSYYKDLTYIEYKEGLPFVSGAATDRVAPKQSNRNYYYSNIGFNFDIPLSDLTNYNGISQNWKVSLSIVATNTTIGNQTFTQTEIYSSTAMASNIISNGYRFLQESLLEEWGSSIYADVGIVRKSPGKTSTNQAYSNGNMLYWYPGTWFYDLSINTTVSSVGYDSITWYRLQYSLPPILYNSRYRVLYGAGNYGWIPSIFLGNMSGTPYSVTVVNNAPVIASKGISYNEATAINDNMLLNLVSATDAQDGDISYKLQIVNRGGLNQSKAKAGTYPITYSVTDRNNVTTTKAIDLVINNVPPTITAQDKEWDEATVITDEMLLENVTASDPYDGHLTNNISIVSYGGLENYMNKAKAGTYQVTYAVTDSNGATTTKDVTITINNVPPEINIMESYEYLYGTTMTEKKVNKLIISANDVYDGDLTSQIFIADLGGLLINDTSNWHKPYTVTYAVTDSNGATTTQTGIIQITYKYIRSISAKALYTIADDSKWKDPILFEKLSDCLLKDPSDDSQCEQVWCFSNEDRLEIQTYITEHPEHSEATSQWFLDNYSDRKILDNTN